MKKVKTYTLCLLAIVFLASCTSDEKLSQERAEKVIKELVSKNSYVLMRKFNLNPPGNELYFEGGAFNVESITSIEPASVYSDNEASFIAQFKYRPANTREVLKLKFNFKRNMEKKWILTSVDGQTNVMRENTSDWSKLDIPVQ